MFHPSSFRIQPCPVRVCSLLLGLLSVASVLGQSFMENRGQVRDQFGEAEQRRALSCWRPRTTPSPCATAGSATTPTPWSGRIRPFGETPYPATKRANVPLGHGLHYHRVDVELVGSDPAAWMEPQRAEGSLSHFYTGGTDHRGRRSFEVVLVHDVYPHIDVEFVAGAASSTTSSCTRGRTSTTSSCATPVRRR
jgi:hypothetical protein